MVYNTVDEKLEAVSEAAADESAESNDGTGMSLSLHNGTLRIMPVENQSTPPSPKNNSSNNNVDDGKALKIIIYGAVNAMMAIPILYGYAAIIFRHPVFAPYMPALAKLVLFSSMIHQMAFSVFSTLPFAIGQVQDAGLIFLSRITTDVAKKVLLQGGTASAAVATALAATAFATASMGVALVLIGKLKLARFVAYLPMPVVGGYLAFIGLFCLEAALGLSSGKDIRGIETWPSLLNKRDLLLCLPCLVIGILWSWVSRRYQHFSVLPLTMLAVPVLFFIALALSGESMQTARDHGLVGPVTQPAELSRSFSLFKFDLVYWSALPGLLPVWIGMIFVVAFSSTLDVAAIEMDMGEPLDTNKELRTVGLSNIISGLTGGFTGSYIFSQTLFTRRTNCQSRLIGWVVTISELALCVVTVDPLEFVPLLFFAATLSFIAVELSVEWLWEVREKLLAYEYLVLMATFVAIQIVGLNPGLMFGVGTSTFFFVVSYASEKRNNLERVHKRGRFMRPASQRRLLQVHRDKILCVELRGELFFGSSQQLLQQVTTMLGLCSASTPAGKAAGGGNGGASGVAGEKERTPNEVVQRWIRRLFKALGKFFAARASRSRSHSKASASPRSLRGRAASRSSRSSSVGGDEERRPLFSGGASFSHGSISTTTAANTFHNIVNGGGIGGGGSSSTSLTSPGGTMFRGGTHFVKPSKSVSFAGDDDADSPRAGLSDYKAGGRARGRAALEGYSPGHSPRAGSGRLILPEKLGNGGVGMGGVVAANGGRNDGTNGASEEAIVPPVEPELNGDGDCWGLFVQGDGSGTPGGNADPLLAQGQGQRGKQNQVRGEVEEEEAEEEEGEMASFVVLDCSKVTNIDASAARTCFLPLQRITENHGVCIAYAGLTERMETLLSVHKAIEKDNVAVFKTFFEALDWCETQLIRSVDSQEEDGHPSFWSKSHFCRRESFKSTAVTIKQLLRQILELPESASAVDGIERYCSEEEYEGGEVIYSVGDEGDSFYVITDGQVLVESDLGRSVTPRQRRADKGRVANGNVALTEQQVLFTVGAIFGYVDYQLEERRTQSAVAVSDTVVTVFKRAHIDRMLEENPRLLCLVERSVMKHLALELSNLPV